MTNLDELDVEDMTKEQVNEYLRQHGFDPDQIVVQGKVFTGALIENLELREALRVARAEVDWLTEWVSVEDRLPDDDCLVLVSLANKPVNQVGTGRCKTNIIGLREWDTGWRVSHWRPLPPPPAVTP